MKKIFDGLKKLKYEVGLQKETTAKIVIIIYRMGYFSEYHSRGLTKKIITLIWYVLDSLIIKLFFNTIIPKNVKIGKGLILSHPFGIIMARGVVIGNNARIRHQVTIGRKQPDNPDVAQIGNNVSIGAGAKIVGPLIIGDNSTIGVNAVVVSSFPNNSTIVGIPAKKI